MMYNVFYYMTFHTKIENIEADSMEEAVKKGLDEAWVAAHDSTYYEFEFAEECTGALVDLQGDDNYLQSTAFSQKEIYDAESRDEPTCDLHRKRG